MAPTVAKLCVTSAVRAPSRAAAAAASVPAWPPPTTMTSNCIHRNLLAEASPPVKRTGSVSRETGSFPDTEIPKDDIEQVLDIHPPRKSTQCIRRVPQLLGAQLEPAGTHPPPSTAPRGTPRAQRDAGPRNQRRLTGLHVLPRERRQEIQQGIKSFARRRTTPGRQRPSKAGLVLHPNRPGRSWSLSATQRPPGSSGSGTCASVASAIAKTTSATPARALARRIPSRSTAPSRFPKTRRVDHRERIAARYRAGPRSGHGWCPARRDTIATSRLANALIRLDLPAFAGPRMTTSAPSRRRSPRCPSSRRRPISAATAAASPHARSDTDRRHILLIRKVQLSLNHGTGFDETRPPPVENAP